MVDSSYSMLMCENVPEATDNEDRPVGKGRARPCCPSLPEWSTQGCRCRIPSPELPRTASPHPRRTTTNSPLPERKQAVADPRDVWPDPPRRRPRRFEAYGHRAGWVTSGSAKRRRHDLRLVRAFVVAWTLADLAGLETPGTDQVTTALEFRDRGAA
ncbi:hypothetical protein GS506_21190 [Rhodococcus hoagii]|nr:hypothetical protein [Prescottella equi]